MIHHINKLKYRNQVTISIETKKKGVWQNLISLHNKNSEDNRAGINLYQCSKGHDKPVFTIMIAQVKL